MTRYAETTSVPADRSRAEIEGILGRYGASTFMYATSADAAMIAFEAMQRRVKFVVPMPARDDPEFWTTPGGKRRREPDAAYKAWEQAGRQRWRALALVIKAKLEAVETGITTFENEFMAHICLPDGQTVGEWVSPQIEQAYVSGQMPPMLALGSGS